MITIQGKSVFGGVSIGKLMFYKRNEKVIKREHISDADAEWKRFEAAKGQAVDQLKELYEKALEDVGDKLPESDKATVQADLNALKALLDQTKDQEMTESQVADMKAAQEKLMQSAQSLFSKMYEQAQQAGGAAGANMGGNAGSADANAAPEDDVIDGDFREV